jgi:cell division protein FtsI/penicillin-binding protein 2
MFDSHRYLQKVRPRAAWLAIVIAGIFALFSVRLFYIQVVQHDHYAQLAWQNQVTKTTIFPERGTIYARDGGDETAPLVLNETVFTVFADPQEVDDIDKIKQVLNQVAGGEVVRDSFDKLSDDGLRYVILAKQVTQTQAQLIQKEDLAGIGLQRGSRRVYPEGQLASQLLGYVNSDGEGQYGIEGALNARLSGQNGQLQAVTDVRRIPLTIGNNNILQPAVDGANLVLTVDRSVQFELEQELKTYADDVRASNASAVIMEPNTGRIVAMANYPTYDPTNFSSVTDYSLFQNRTVDNPYEAGSVIKTLTVATGLDSGTITPTSTTPNPNGCTIVEDRRICNSTLRGIPTNPTTYDLLRYSLNTGAVGVVRTLGGGGLNYTAREKLYEYFHNRFRFGSLTGVEQSDEAAGIIYSPDDEEGNDVRYANMSFGQGMTTTMVQVATAFSTVINGGTYYKPTLVYGTRSDDGTVTEQAPQAVASAVISPAHSAEERDLVWRARYDNNGNYTDPAGYMIGGKTGTSQTIDPTTGEYTTDKTIGSYLGFVGGTKTPRYVIMIRMDDAQGGVYIGSGAANKMFGSMARWLINYENITPNE